MRYYHDGMDGGGGWLLMTLLMLFVLVLAVGALIWVLRANHGPRWHQADSSVATSRQILDERYARGEIDEEEYQRRRAILAAR